MPLCPSTTSLASTAKLNFTQDALAGIYLGKITKWNDPYIQSANPKVKLPANNIIVVHRSEGSGTTFIWTDYLSKVSPEWKSKVGAGAAVNWPVGLGGKGSEGVSGLVKQSPNSIGYVELVYALSNKIVSGPVRNSAGNFIEASLASVTAAAARSRQEHASRLPRLHHRCSRRTNLPHCQLHLDADPA